MSGKSATVDRRTEAPIRGGAKVLAFALGLAAAIGPYVVLRPRVATLLGTTHLVSVADPGEHR